MSEPYHRVLRDCELEFMSDQEILAAVREMESTYKQTGHEFNDYRQHLSRNEIETVFHLVSRVVELRSKGRASTPQPHVMADRPSSEA